MAKIIDGKAISAEIRAEIKAEVEQRIARGECRPGLAVIIVGEDPASQVYVRNKKKISSMPTTRYTVYCVSCLCQSILTKMRSFSE